MLRKQFVKSLAESAAVTYVVRMYGESTSSSAEGPGVMRNTRGILKHSGPFAVKPVVPKMHSMKEVGKLPQREV
jgi:hypothetical protein